MYFELTTLMESIVIVMLFSIGIYFAVKKAIIDAHDTIETKKTVKNEDNNKL